MFSAQAGSYSPPDQLRLWARYFFKPIPTDIPELRDNIATPQRVHLGRLLFFEPRLSKSGWISCSTCQNLGMGGDDDLELSVGHLWTRGHRNTQTVLNAVLNVDQLWDGRAIDLMVQTVVPMLADEEMSNDPNRIIATLESIPEYVKLFRAAFPLKSDDPVTQRR